MPLKIIVKNVFKNKIFTLLLLRMNSRWTLNMIFWRKMHGSKPPNLVVWRIVSLRGFLIFLCFYNIFNDSPPKSEWNTMCYFSQFKKKWCYPHLQLHSQILEYWKYVYLKVITIPENERRMFFGSDILQI